jgi:hypothetical protein
MTTEPAWVPAFSISLVDVTGAGPSQWAYPGDVRVVWHEPTRNGLSWEAQWVRPLTGADMRPLPKQRGPRLKLP